MMPVQCCDYSFGFWMQTEPKTFGQITFVWPSLLHSWRSLLYICIYKVSRVGVNDGYASKNNMRLPSVN